MKLGCSASLLFVVAISHGQGGAAGLTIGQTPPAPKTIAYRGQQLNEFKPGICYVLEFWGTWCGPCRSAIPHLNELVKSEKDAKVEFYSIALGDSRANLDQFLKKFELDSNIVLDDRAATSNAYNIHIVPRTVLVGADGRVAAVTDPQKVTPAVLTKLIAGEPLELPLANLKSVNFDWIQKLPTTSKSYLWIEESDSGGGGYRWRPGSGEMSGDGLISQSILSLAYDVDYYHTDWRVKNLDNLAYRLAVKAPVPDDSVVREMMRPLLKSMFGLAARWEELDKDVYVLRRDPAKPLNLPPPASTETNARHGDIDWPSATPDKFSEIVGNICLDSIVVNEANLGEAKFSFKLKWVPGDTASAIKAVEDLGFTVTKEKRKVKMLVVESTSK